MASSKVDIWMPVYVGDYLADTGHLSTEQHGCYFLWMLHYWRKGPLPNDLGALCVIARLHGKDGEATANYMLNEFFSLQEDNKWHNKRLDIEREKAYGKRNKRSESGTTGAIAKWGNSEDRGKVSRSERLANARQLATHSPEEWQALRDVLGDMCVKCQVPGKEAEIVRDHIVPMYQNGSDGIENIQPMCRTCNAAKGPDRTDYRPQNWRELLAKRLANGRQTSGESPSPSPSPSSLPKSKGQPELPLSSATPTVESPKEAPDLPLLDPVPAEPRVRPEEYANVWNRHRGKLPKVEEFSESRRKKVLTRIKQGITLERFQEAVENCVVKPFLHGDNDSGWVATFDWLIENDKNVEKAITQPYGLNRKEKHAQVPLTKTERNMAVLAEALGRGKSQSSADEAGSVPPRGVGPDEPRTLHASVTPIRGPADSASRDSEPSGEKAGGRTNGSSLPW